MRRDRWCMVTAFQQNVIKKLVAVLKHNRNSHWKKSSKSFIVFSQWVPLDGGDFLKCFFVSIVNLNRTTLLVFTSKNCQVWKMLLYHSSVVVFFLFLSSAITSDALWWFFFIWWICIAFYAALFVNNFRVVGHVFFLSSIFRVFSYI